MFSLDENYLVDNYLVDNYSDWMISIIRMNMVFLLLHKTRRQSQVLITRIPYEWMGHDLFISTKLVSLSQKVLGCINFVIMQL